MKVKELKRLLDLLDNGLDVCIQTKSKNTPCLYGIYNLRSQDIAVQSIKGEKYLAIGDVVFPETMEARTCYGERIKYEIQKEF